MFSCKQILLHPPHPSTTLHPSHGSNVGYTSPMRNLRNVSVLFLAVTTLCVFGLWGDVILTSFSGDAAKQVAFRDAAHFYYPLHQRLKNDWQRATFPARDVVANPTSGVFYPPAWICFTLLPTPLDEHVFIIAHIFLAAWTTFRLARSLGCSSYAATFAGVAYAFSGSVLFQQCNIVFLIGAAWFPEAVRLVLRIIQRQNVKHFLALAAVVSLILFGGDWQAVYHVALFAVAAFVWSLFGRTQTTWSTRTHAASMILSAFLIAATATVVQTVPTLRAAIESDRTGGDHIARIDNYSIHPLRLLELVYPNFSGDQFPQHRRWILAAEPRGIWTPSLYAGMIPAVLAMASLRLWGKRCLVALTWCLIVAVVASMGSAGGVYTILMQLPFYEMFRYPAKWFTVAALPIALLAAHSLDALQSQAAIVRRIALATGIVIATTMVAVPLVFWRDVPACPLFGVFDAENAYTAFVFGGAWGAGIVLVVAALCVRFGIAEPSSVWFGYAE
ncbi:MAG: hypothetical protein ACRC46_06380, partial [Thermoguttaceae bacterium]